MKLGLLGVCLAASGALSIGCAGSDGGGGDGGNRVVSGSGSGGDGGAAPVCPALAGPTLLTPWTNAEAADVVQASDEFVVTATHLYWRTSAGISRVEKAVGAKSELVVADVHDPFVVDGDHVYWCSYGSVQRAPLAGGDREPVGSVPSGDWPMDRCVVAVDETSITWIVSSSDFDKGYAILRAPKAGGAVGVILDQRSAMNDFDDLALATVGTTVFTSGSYRSDGGGFFLDAISADGKITSVFTGDPRTAENLPWQVRTLRTDGQVFYFSAKDNVYRLDAANPDTFTYENDNTADVATDGTHWFSLRMPHDDEVGEKPPAEILELLIAERPTILSQDVTIGKAWGFGADSCNFYWATDKGIRAQPLPK